MKKENIKLIIIVIISILLLIIGTRILNVYTFATIQEIKIVEILIHLFALLCLTFGIFGLLITIFFAIDKINQYEEKRYQKRKEIHEKQIKSGLPKDTEFSVKLLDENDESINEFICKNIKSTAVYNGETIRIELILPEKLVIYTDQFLWFKNTFDY